MSQTVFKIKTYHKIARYYKSDVDKYGNIHSEAPGFVSAMKKYCGVIAIVDDTHINFNSNVMSLYEWGWNKRWITKLECSHE